VLFGGRSGDVANLLEPPVEFVFADSACVSLYLSRLPVSSATPGVADMTHNAHETPAGKEDSVNMPPDFLQLEQERLVVMDVAELVRVFVVPLEIPIWRRSDHEVD